MPYTTLEFYTNEYAGEHLEQDEFDKLLKHAERKIDSVTFYRIRKSGLNRLANLFSIKYS